MNLLSTRSCDSQCSYMFAQPTQTEGKSPLAMRKAQAFHSIVNFLLLNSTLSLQDIKPQSGSTNSRLLFHSASVFMMSLLMSLVLVFLAIASHVFGKSMIESQPYCHPVSRDFETSPNYWLHATPVLRSHWDFQYVPLVRRQEADYWTSWNNINYLFALWVLPK